MEMITLPVLEFIERIICHIPNKNSEIFATVGSWQADTEENSYPWFTNSLILKILLSQKSTSRGEL